MNWHIFERVSTHIGLTGAVAALGVISGAEKWLDLAAKIPTQWWVVLWMAGVTIFMMQWAIRVGQRTPRTPNGEMSRLKQELNEERRERLALDKRLDKACETLARIEGELHGLVEVGNKE